MEPLSGRVLARWAGALLVGLVVGVVGTAVHRAMVPWGLVLALATVLSAAVLARAWSGLAGVLAVAAGTFLAVQLMGGRGPGGDVLIPAQSLSVIWAYGHLGLYAVAAFAPRGWFVDEARSRPGRDGPGST
ncbi:DUF6113 family protein [Actinotalea sp. K2]|uniref:DUF6113 family protein n=1 Tax=Actinotalea sp. K2 TaxID=2939438 RepID=UPI0020182FCD|nr:DUF6113 family protein [Actinotalea sp. K2]MCL3862591.1 DUF6113 family protein [Actinotalea sp. K2]